MRDPDLKNHHLIEQSFDLLRDGATLITATTRLSREISRVYSRIQRENGLTSWETPDILPYPSWLERTWKRLRAACGSQQPGLNTVLNPLQSRQLWKRVIGHDIQSHHSDAESPLWNVDATVRSAMDSWRICRQWDIDFNNFGDLCLADHRNFARWAGEYELLCQRQGWLDPHQLPDDIAVRIDQGIQPNLPHLLWAGFERLKPDQERLLARLRAVGITASVLSADGLPATSQHCTQFDSGHSQWLAAAQWARDTLQRNPEYRLAIVAPDLIRSRPVIESAFTRTLCPESLIDPEKSHHRPFHIALGKELAAIPVVRSAINLLALLTEDKVAFETIASMLIDPYIRGATPERAQRHQLEYRYRHQFPYQISVSAAWEQISKTDGNRDPSAQTPELVQILDRLTPELGKSRQTLLYSEWATVFMAWLTGFGWPGDETPGSAEYQVIQAFKKEVERLATLDMVVTTQVSLAEALAVLTGRLETQPFEPESAEVKVEIMGILESAGLEFDAVWFANLNQPEWPPRLNKSPFIPAALQSAAGYFKADFDLNHEHASNLQQQLTNRCRQIIFSRSRFEADAEQLPSPLVAWPGGSPETAQPGPSLLDHYQQHRPAMEVFEDRLGLPVTTADVRGGTFIIEDQSACPFRSYALHRLKARENEYRQPGPDAIDRGSLIHRILENIWKKIKTSKRLEAMQQDELETLIQQVIEECSQRGVYRSGLDKGFFEIQAGWLKNLMLEWFALELYRAEDFEVAEMEETYVLQLGGLNLSFKVDRIDRLADGSWVMIDYKTGATGNISTWIGERPKHPQLPLYTLAKINHTGNHDDSIAAIAYGQVRHADCLYRGIEISPTFNDESITPLIKQVRPLEKARIDPLLRIWPMLLSDWETHLERLAQSFAAGQAAVNPRDRTVCTYCNLTGLCRRHELNADSHHQTEPET